MKYTAVEKIKWPITGHRLFCMAMLDSGISLATWWLCDNIIINSLSSSSSMMRRSAAVEEFT